MYTRNGDSVRLELTHGEYTTLMFALGLASGQIVKGEGATGAMSRQLARLIASITDGNADYAAGGAVSTFIPITEGHTH
jgi:hypothetical protein